MSKFIITILSFGAFLPVIASAQLTVPVTAAGTAAAVAGGESATEDMSSVLRDLSNTIGRYTMEDEQFSLRTLLTGNPSQSIAAGLLIPSLKGNEIPDTDDTIAKTIDPENKCLLRHIADTRKGVPREAGNWDYLLKNGGFLPVGSDPTNMSDQDFADQAAQQGDFSAVQVNNSKSVSCLLQELVEWKKLSLNLQIHELLHNQIVSAQARIVANRLSGMNAAAVTRQSEASNQLPIRDADGNVIATESFPAWSDPKLYACELIKRRARQMADTLLASDNPTRFETARQIYQEQNAQCETLAGFEDSVPNSLVNKDNPDAGAFASQKDVQDYFNGVSTNARHDPITLLEEMNKTNNNPRNSTSDAVSRFRSMATEIRETVGERYQANGGFMPTEECPPNSKNCDISEMRIVTPGAIERQAVENATNNYQKQLDSIDGAEGLTALNSDGSTADIITKGFTNFDENNFEKDPPMYEYVREFYNGIRGGYYDIQGGTTDWASGAMLSIFDNIVTDPHMYREGAEQNLNDSSEIPKPQ